MTIDVIENALRNAREEMDAVVFRSAMSPGIREQHDEFPMIADPRRAHGRQVSSACRSQISSQATTVSIEEGDVIFTSDPYSCDGAISHANDWLVVMPIYVDGRVVGWSAQLGHMTDVGGKVPGSLPTDATTIFEEGILVPPVKLYSKGRAEQRDAGSDAQRRPHEAVEQDRP